MVSSPLPPLLPSIGDAMAPLILFAILFVCGFFFPPSKLLPWLLSFVSIPANPKPVAQEINTQQQKKRDFIDAAATPDLEIIFSTFDTDGDGFITVSELEESLSRLGLPAPRAEVVGMVERVDANGDGLIDLEEFKKLYESIIGGDDGRGTDGVELEMKDAFDIFDGNGDGVITVEELGMVLKSMGMKHGDREDCRDMIKKVDLDGDGMVNFEEFKKMMMEKGGKLF